MKILSARQIKEADAFTIKNEPVSGIDLMERAAKACFQWIVGNVPKGHPIHVFCGTGNNGGDGLAISRMLVDHGYLVAVYWIRTGANASAEFKTNELRLGKRNISHFTEIATVADMPLLTAEEYIIDALLGIGLNKSTQGLIAEVIQTINKSDARVISIDIPSGLFADKHSIISENSIVKAQFTLSFQLYKYAYMFPETATYTGEVILLPIGLSDVFITNCASEYSILEGIYIRHILKKRSSFSHKGNYGRALIMAGSFGKMGAAVLAAKACLRSGAGLITVYTPRCGYEIVQTSIPEAMVVCDTTENHLSGIPSLDSINAVGIGPGIGTGKETTLVVKQMLKSCQSPMVIDADALNVISENKSYLEFIPAGSILTPHVKEFERLAGNSENGFNRHKLQIEFSKNHQVIVILKGKFTCITTPDGRSFFNPTGNPGMAKGGSGDALTGMLTALLAQGYTPEQSSVAAVYLHGLAADIAIKKTGEYSLLATDLIDHIGPAILQLPAAE